MQHATCNMNMQRATHTQRASCIMQHAKCKMKYATRNTHHVTCNMQRSMCHMQRATCNMQHATCNMRHATYKPSYNFAARHTPIMQYEMTLNSLLHALSFSRQKGLYTPYHFSTRFQGKRDYTLYHFSTPRNRNPTTFHASVFAICRYPCTRACRVQLARCMMPRICHLLYIYMFFLSPAANRLSIRICFLSNSFAFVGSCFFPCISCLCMFFSCYRLVQNVIINRVFCMFAEDCMSQLCFGSGW